MLQRITIRNFKQFEFVDIPLGDAVVFIGPNNSGKTSALQALGLWELGVRRWNEKRGGKAPPKKRSGVTLNRRDLLALPVPEANLLWRNLHVRETTRGDGKRRTDNIRIEIEVFGVTRGREWSCGLEFDYANPESLYCRPLSGAAESKIPFQVPPEALEVRVAHLQPMSGLAANEPRLDPGTVLVRMGEGRTAEVLRNLCYSLFEHEDSARWGALVEHARALFGVTLSAPDYIPERGELVMAYTDARGIKLDIAAAGRGFQQTLLLLAYLLGNPGSVLLLDEPDAHLEILRQRQIYQTIVTTAQQGGSQVIAASHSEVILNEAADRDVVVAFVGTPHRIDDRGSQVVKALKSIGFDQYYLAEEKGWVLYVEGSTDLATLQSFAATLSHPASSALERVFVHYVANQVSKARDHFHGLREAKPDLVGIVVLDAPDGEPRGESPHLPVRYWARREIENYLGTPDVLRRYARNLAEDTAIGPLFAVGRGDEFAEAMESAIRDRLPPAAMRNPADAWWSRTKITDDFLDPVFAAFFDAVSLPNLMRKTDYHRLASLLPAEEVHADVLAVLDVIAETARCAAPRTADGA